MSTCLIHPHTWRLRLQEVAKAISLGASSPPHHTCTCLNVLPGLIPRTHGASLVLASLSACMQRRRTPLAENTLHAFEGYLEQTIPVPIVMGEPSCTFTSQCKAL
jgi:hypothetical protein